MEVSSPRVVPDFSDSNGGASASLRVLKEKCEAAKSLGVVRCDDAEMLIVYDGQTLSTRLFRSLTLFQKLVATSTSTASPLAWLGTFRGSVKPRHMRIVDTTCYCSLLDSSRCAPLPRDSSSR